MQSSLRIFLDEKLLRCSFVSAVMLLRSHPSPPEEKPARTLTFHSCTRLAPHVLFPVRAHSIAYNKEEECILSENVFFIHLLRSSFSSPLARSHRACGRGDIFSICAHHCAETEVHDCNSEWISYRRIRSDATDVSNCVI